MMRPEALALMDDASHAGVKDILASPEALLAHMDTEGVTRACLINYVSPDVMGFTPAAIDWVCEFARDHGDRLLPVGSVHPVVTPDVREETERILALGVRMIKIHPPHQWFSPNDYRGDLPRLAELYEICEGRGIPVMFHTGTSIFPRARNVFADPMPIDDVANDFPNLPIILAHAGRPLFGGTAVFLARRHANVYLDLSGIPPRAIARYVPGWEKLTDKLLWGTDWPSPGIVSMQANVQAFRELASDPKTAERVLWENAERLFGTA